MSSRMTSEAGHQAASIDADIRLLTLPTPEEQRLIVGALEADGVEESLHVYTVSRDWYNQWRSYVGLPTVSASGPEVDCTSAVSESRHDSACRATSSGTSSVGSSGSTRAVPCNSPGGARRTKDTSSPVATSAAGDGVTVTAAMTSQHDHPGPVEMDLSIDDDNMSVDEKIWIKWIEWFGLAESHELDRRRWTVDERDFEICVMSPYCGLVENAVKSFDLTEKTGYVELQLRRVFRVARHRRTRLWVCEKSRHARFQPLLDRAQELCFQDSIDSNKNYILAIEMANPDGSWPSHVPGDPVGEFDRYAALYYGQRRQHNTTTSRSFGVSDRLQSTSGANDGAAAVGSPLWESELTDTLDTVFGGIAAELKETTTGIVATARCMMTERQAELRGAVEALEASRRQVDDRTADLERTAVELTRQETSLAAAKEQLKTDRATFDGERQKFAEELVRMLTVNKIQDSRIKLNVGGHVFVTSTLTLTKDPDTMLAAMFSGRHALRQDDDGSYFIDRDGTHFRYILNFLRDGCCFRPGTLPLDRAFLSELLTEAEYYQVSSLVCLLNEHIRAAAAATVENDDDDDGDDETGYFGEVGTTRPPKTVGVFPSVNVSSVTRIGLSPASVGRRQKLLRKISTPPQQQQQQQQLSPPASQTGK